jgi:hypothetical protein
MLRGHSTAYLSLFDEPDQVMIIPPPERRGRSEALVLKRNELLMHRHWYYIKIMGRQYPVTLQLLEDEFFLTQRTIVDIFQRNTLLKELNTAKPGVKYFKDKYPFMIW